MLPPPAAPSNLGNEAGAATIPEHDGRPADALADRARRSAEPARAGSHGRRQRAGVSPPGPPFRGWSRLLRDGELRRPAAPERALARLSAHLRRRASAGRSDLRVGARGDGRGGADGRGGRRRHRRHQLRLPGAQGDEDRRRGDPARGSRAGLPHRRGRGGRSLGPGDREDAPRARERLTRVPRSAHASSRRARRGSPCIPVRRCRCTRVGRTTPLRPSSSHACASP